MPDDLNYSAPAEMLGETIASAPGQDAVAMPDRTGATLPYFGDYVLEREIARGGMGVVASSIKRGRSRWGAPSRFPVRALRGCAATQSGDCTPRI